MDKERKIGTPYLQDRKVIDLLAKYRSELYSDMITNNNNLEKVTNFFLYAYNSILSNYRKEIEDDNHNVVYEIELPEKPKEESEEITDKKVLSKFPYIQELAIPFAKELKDFKRSLISFNKKQLVFDEYGSEIESYYMAIHDLDGIILGFESATRFIVKSISNPQNQKQTVTREKKFTEKDKEGLDPQRLSLFLKYFDPKDDFYNQDKNKILRTILMTPTGKGRNSRTREILNSLQTFFKQKDTFNFIDGSTIFRNNKERAKIISDISFNSKPETIYRFFKEGELKELSKPTKE